MGLSLKDKFNLTKRFIKVLFSGTDQIGLTWKDDTRIQSYHVYNDKKVHRYNIHLEYMAQAAAHSKSIPDLNERLMYFTEKTLIAYCRINKIDNSEMIFTPPNAVLKEQENTNDN